MTLPDGRVLPKPGNLFGVLESTFWGTYADFTSGIEADLDGNGTVDFGEKLPDANVLKAGADTLDKYTTELGTASSEWQPTESDAFTALVVMVPTMSEYFNSWKNSRFILGDASEQRDFVVISRLSDIQNILGSLQIVFGEVKPLVESTDAAQAAQIEQSLADLKSFRCGCICKGTGRLPAHARRSGCAWSGSTEPCDRHCRAGRADRCETEHHN